MILADHFLETGLKKKTGMAVEESRGVLRSFVGMIGSSFLGNGDPGIPDGG